jgi:hypothetical protein
MTALGRRDYKFFDITRLRQVGSRFFAMSGLRQTVLVATVSGGLTSIVGETADLGAEAIDVVAVSTDLFILLENGVAVAGVADTPVVSDSVTYDVGDGQWILASGNYVIAPAKGGLRVFDADDLDTFTFTTAPGMGASTAAAISSEDLLYVADGVRAKIHVFRVLGNIAVYVNSFRAPNCRDIIKVELDEANETLIVLCKRNAVQFSIPNTGVEDSDVEVVKVSESGDVGYDYSDVVVTPDGYWFGVDGDTPLNPNAGHFMGRQYGVFNASTDELILACPDQCWFAASNVVPLVEEVSEVEDVVDEVVPPPVIVTPAAPVITSLLTDDTVEDTLWTYTITATGSGPIYFDIASPPSWLTSINHITGVISGTPPDAATVNLNITATNAGGTDSETLVLTVEGALGDVSAVRTNGPVTALRVVGTLLYVGGAFSSVTDSSGTVTRNFAACLNLQTGLWTAWNPNCAGSSIQAIGSDGSYIYLGFAAPAGTIGGTTRNGCGRVNPTTGALDSWNPNIDGGVEDFLFDGSDMYVCGAFFTAGGNPHEYVAKYSGTTLQSWRPQENIGGGGPRYLVAHSANRVSRMFDRGGNIALFGGMAMRDVVSGYWGQELLEVSKTTALPTLSVNGTNSGCLIAAVQAGGSVYCGEINGGTTYYTTLPTEAPQFGPFAPRHPVSYTNTTFNTSWNPVFLNGSTGNILALAEVDGDLIIAGGYTQLNGNTNHEYLNRVTTSGATVSGFVAAWAGGAPSCTALATFSSAVIVGGTFGGSITLNGADRDNIAFLNKDTGAVL